MLDLMFLILTDAMLMLESRRQGLKNHQRDYSFAMGNEQFLS